MAELILTNKEKNANSLLSWSDEALGKAVRFCITTLLNGEKERESVFAIACGQILCAIAAKANATELKMKLEGVTFEDKHLGDWCVLVERITDKHPLKLTEDAGSFS